MSQWPKTAQQLIAEGYVLAKMVDTCKWKGCFAQILWCTTPKGKQMPLSLAGSGPEGEHLYESHFAKCLGASSFRRGK
jgi:hypothetical protein